MEQSRNAPQRRRTGTKLSGTCWLSCERYVLRSGWTILTSKCAIHPYLLEEAFPDTYNAGTHVIENSGKFIILQKMLNQFVITEKKKVIIFSGFDQALNLCEDILTHMQGRPRKFEYARIDGNTASAWRNLGIYLFTNDERYKVFLISIRAGGEGLNLASASKVVFLDEDWNPQVMRQAEARAHRLGQTKPVTIFKIHSRGTVEEQMLGRLAKKAYLGAKITENMQTPNTLEELGDMVEKDGGNTSGSAAVIVSFLESLMRRKRLSDNQIDVTKLLSWDWETVLENCTDARSEEKLAECITEEVEQAWLERRERIKTNVFNGRAVKKAAKYPTPEDQPEVPRAQRRIGKERVVLVDGYEVTKENLSLDDESSPSSRSRNESNQKTPINHDSTCFLCQKPANLPCQSCPRTFHKTCLDHTSDTSSSSPSPYKSQHVFICPHHYCSKCRKTASQAGQLLYSCVSCTRAFCEQCLDWGGTRFLGTEVYEEGISSESAFYVGCFECMKGGKRKAGSGDEDVDVVKRVKS